jgi:hypothetical protein
LSRDGKSGAVVLLEVVLPCFGMRQWLLLHITHLTGACVSSLRFLHFFLFCILQKYGELAPTAPQAAAGSSLASNMVQLTICHGAKRLEKKLPGEQAGRVLSSVLPASFTL